MVSSVVRGHVPGGRDRRDANHPAVSASMHQTPPCVAVCSLPSECWFFVLNMMCLRVHSDLVRIPDRSDALLGQAAHYTEGELLLNHPNWETVSCPSVWQLELSDETYCTVLHQQFVLWYQKSYYWVSFPWIDQVLLSSRSLYTWLLCINAWQGVYRWNWTGNWHFWTSLDNISTL